MADEVLERVEKLRRKFANERDGNLVKAHNSVGDAAITEALFKAMAAQRKLISFLHAVQELSGVRRWTAEIRRPLSYFVAEDSLKHRLYAMRGQATPTVTLPPEALAIIAALKQNPPPASGPKFVELHDLSPAELEALKNPPLSQYELERAAMRGREPSSEY
jgi:hypothetical protein